MNRQAFQSAITTCQNKINFSKNNLRIVETKKLQISNEKLKVHQSKPFYDQLCNCP